MPGDRQSARTWWLAGGALLAALAIYVLFRDGLWLHRLLASLAIPSGQLVGHAPDWLVYVLPDGLWQFAFCALVAHHTERPILLAAPLAIGIGIELLSAVHLVEGVFDPLDLLAMGIGGALGYRVASPQPRADRTATMMVAGFSLMLAATSKAPPSSRGKGPSPAPLPPTTLSPSAVPAFEVPAPQSGPLRSVPGAGLQLRLPAGSRLLDAPPSPSPSREPTGPAIGIALPSGYEARIDTRDLDLSEATDNARAHEKRGGVEILLAADDAVVAAYGDGCGAMACKTVGARRLCGAIGAPDSRPDAGEAEPLPTWDDCAAFVAAVRSLEPL